MAGRPSKFNESLKDIMLRLYKSGKTDAQVAQIVGVSEKTINTWKGKHPEFLQSLKQAKSIADDLVVASLFQRAIGYSHPDEKLFCTKEGEIKRERITRHYPPDTTAAIFWLKNRSPQEWRESQPQQSDSSTSESLPNLKLFAQFCVDAGYFEPYPKQIEMKDFGLNETVVRLLLGARGYGKTDFVTIMGTAYWLYSAWRMGLDPAEHTALIVTKSKARNMAIINEVAIALEKNGVQLDKSNASVIRLEGLIGQDHSVEAITIKSSMRGRHPKLIIMDDPVTDEDVSEAMRSTVKRRYDEAYKLCKNILIIGQPAHQHDLYAELRGIVKTMEVPHGTIPQLDADLEAMRLAGVDPHSIEMSYHLKIPRSGAIPFDNIRYVDRFPTGESAVAFIDPSHEGGDYTALSIVRAWMDGVAVVGFTYKKAWNHCIDEMVQRLNQFKVQRLCFETNALGDQPIIMLRQALPKIGVVGKKSNTNKHSRIMAAGSYAHLIHLSKESDRIYTDQVVKYEYKAKNDDAPDSLASCLEWIGLIRGKL